jgi:hypothetical protein
MSNTNKFADRFDANVFWNKIFVYAGQIVYSSTIAGIRSDETHPRAWFYREVNRYEMLPIIHTLITKHLYRPKDWQQLLLEHPHKSTKDPSMVAYTENEAKGRADRQAVTSLGKYLRRHFDMPDHELRDLVALHAGTGKMEIRKTTEEIVQAAKEGPTSCMSHNFKLRSNDGDLLHPYMVYAPELGWSVAVRLNGDRIDGRALVYSNGQGDAAPYFVRSYKRCPNGGYSYADEVLEAWLKDQGINKRHSWDHGTELKAIRCEGTWLAPYIDGDRRDVVERGDKLVIIHGDEDGEYTCDNTNGLAEERDVIYCEDCEDRTSDDDSYFVGRWEDRRVCCNCIDNYTHAFGAGGREYYIDNDDAICTEEGDWYDVNFLSDNNIVELVDGDYTHIDNAVYVESRESYYHEDDVGRYVVYAEDTGEYAMIDDCWKCHESKNWYTSDTEYVDLDGETYHPDNVPETEEETNTTATGE